MGDRPVSHHKSPVVPGIISVAVLVILGAAAMALKSKNQPANNQSSNNNVQSESSNNTSAENTTASHYKSGTYTATGSYISPGGTEQIEVSITLDGDIIKDTSVNPRPASTTSPIYQGEFARGYKVMVIGKDIDDVKLSRVSGSSLTSRGFHDALNQIKNQAKI